MSALKPIAIASLANEAFEKIVQAITLGELQPGQKLSEASLARQLGISRGPLREALGRLEGRLVERKPRLGVNVIQLSDEDLIELFAVREALEGMACRLAATNATDAELDRLNALLKAHSKDRGVLNEARYFQRTSDGDFHFQIVSYARNDRLAEVLLENLYHQLRLYRFASSEKPGRAKAAFLEHKQIVAALLARDPQAAEDSMRAHIRGALAGFIANRGERIEAPVARPSRRAVARRTSG